MQDKQRPVAREHVLAVAQLVNALSELVDKFPDPSDRYNLLGAMELLIDAAMRCDEAHRYGIYAAYGADAAGEVDA